MVSRWRRKASTNPAQSVLVLPFFSQNTPPLPLSLHPCITQCNLTCASQHWCWMQHRQTSTIPLCCCCSQVARIGLYGTFATVGASAGVAALASHIVRNVLSIVLIFMYPILTTQTSSTSKHFQVTSATKWLLFLCSKIHCLLKYSLHFPWCSSIT